MEEELNYLSTKIEKIQARVEDKKKNPNLSRSEGLQAILRYREKELVLLNNILNSITINELK